MSAWTIFSRVSLPLLVAGVTTISGAAETPEWRATVEADWLLQAAKRYTVTSGVNVTCENDAAGGVDGVKTGEWGFHTEHEPNPWWQVDLSQPMKLDRVVLYNRCDGCGERNKRIIILASDDGKDFKQLYQHDGTMFYGFTDKKPLVVELKGAAARFVRLRLVGTSYFHLDEVEVYPVGSDKNVALGKPATQSSVSQWSVAPGGSPAMSYPTAQITERGLKLAAKLGNPPGPLQAIAAELKQLPANASDDAQRALFFRAHWAVREIALTSPLLNFDSILFVKRAPGVFPHMSDQHYGWWSRPGGGIYTLEGFKTGQPRVRCLTSDMPPGSFIGPDLSYDGKRVLFAYCRYYPDVADQKNKADKANVPADAFYHIYVMNVDGSGRRQLTSGKYDDFDPRWLPNGDVLFLSTRKGLALQCTKTFSDATRTANLPDSYVRCGGDNYRPVPVFTLHAMSADGRDIRPLSAFENFEWTPSIANDGRIIYARWDYIDRFNGPFISLWSANQDGSNSQLVYGNYTVKPQLVFEARSIPSSTKLVFTASAHHSITGGSLCLLDRSKGIEEQAPLTRLTPEVCFPETEGWPEHYYTNPWPLSEDLFLVGWADAKLPPHCRVDDSARNPVNAMGIYLYDAFGNLELLHRDPEISSMYPIPVAPRRRPPAQPNMIAWDEAREGSFLVQDVYRGLDAVPRGTVKRLRIIGVPPKTQPHMNNPNLGVSAEDPGKFVLGTVPVEADGSAHFRVPSGIPVLFQALDDKGLAVQTMRSLTYVWPKQTLACVGCHEHRDMAPVSTKPPLAARRQPSRITPGPSGSWPLRFDQLVQPVLDQYCVKCHDAKDKLDLTPPKAYQSLISFGGDDLKNKAKERDRSFVGQCTTANSKLWKLLADPAGHREVRLDAESMDRLATWMDTYAQRLGHFSDEQEKSLQDLRVELAPLLLESH